MTNHLLKGKLITLAAIAALLSSAWWIREIAPSLRIPRWVGVPLAVLLVVYLHLGYRGFRWIVGVLLVVAGGAATYQIAISGSSVGTRQVGLLLLVLATLVLGPVLGVSRAVGSYLEDRRSRRPEIAAAVLVAVWIVILAIAAVWVWVGAGVQVF
jgi:hypothetical protein